MTAFPHANEVMKPIGRFCIHGRWLNLYFVKGRMPGAAYSLYWDDEQNPVRHAMTPSEVFASLAGLLNDHPATSDPQTENEQLRAAIRDAGFGIMKTSAGYSIHDVSEKAKADEEKTTQVILENIDLQAEVRALRESNRIFEQNSADAALDAETIKAMVADIQALGVSTIGGRLDDHTSEVGTEALWNVLQWASANQMAQRRQEIIRRYHLWPSEERHEKLG